MHKSFRTILVISCSRFGHFVPSNNHFVQRLFRTHFGHFVPKRLTRDCYVSILLEYVMTKLGTNWANWVRNGQNEIKCGYEMANMVQ